jgi:hypothetical protein
MAMKLSEVDNCMNDGGVAWTFDRPSQPGSPVKAFCYWQGRQFAVSGADEILPLLLQLQELGLALGLQTVPERGDCPRVIKWRGAHSQALTTAASPWAHVSPCGARPTQQSVAKERTACLP